MTRKPYISYAERRRKAENIRGAILLSLVMPPVLFFVAAMAHYISR